MTPKARKTVAQSLDKLDHLIPFESQWLQSTPYDIQVPNADCRFAVRHREGDVSSNGTENRRKGLSEPVYLVFDAIGSPQLASRRFGECQIGSRRKRFAQTREKPRISRPEAGVK
jgi:hypothetical protein